MDLRLVKSFYDHPPKLLMNFVTITEKRQNVEWRIFTKENLNNSMLYQVLTLIKPRRMGWSAFAICKLRVIFIYFYLENSNFLDYLGSLVVDKRIILKWIVRK